MSKGFRVSLAGVALFVALCQGIAADPGEAWLTGDASAPDGVQWLASASLCRVTQDKLPQALATLEMQAFAALTAASLGSYASAACKGKYGQFPYLVRAVTTAGEGHLDAGLIHGELWMHFAGLGGRDPFAKTPVVVWLYGPPTRVHVTAGIVE